MKLGVLISGRGSNLKSLIDACAAPDFPAEIVCVLSNNPEAGGLIHAQAARIPAHVINHKDFARRETFEASLDEALRAAGVELVCNAGFMRILTASFVDKWHNRQINIHPSLLPAFTGLHVHQRAIEAGVRISGCTVHYVRAEMDKGPIIAQAAVPVFPDDTPESLSARVLEAEHALYPMAVRLIAEGKVRLAGERVMLRTAQQEIAGPLFVPPLDDRPPPDDR